MLENSVIQITAGKFIGVTLLPSTLLLISGIIAWRLWKSKQTQLQAETDDLNDEVQQMKKQLADLHVTNNANQPTTEATSPQQNSGQKIDPDKTGLFEYLISDNIKLRRRTSK